MNVTKVTSLNLKERMTLTYCLISLLCMIFIDLIASYDRNLSFKDMILGTALEFAILGVTLFMGHFLWSRFVRVSQERVSAQQGLEDALDAVRELKGRERVHKEDFEGSCRVLFSEWCLTKSEVEIAHLLLSAKSLKEIAAFRFTSEGTLKNQARSIYQKAMVKNRVEFMALIIENSTLQPAMINSRASRFLAQSNLQ